MAGIRLEFAQFGHFDSFDIIRSVNSMAGVADVDLPTPIVTGLKMMYYVDSNVVKGAIYYYKVRVWRGTTSFVSDEIDTYAIDGFAAQAKFISDLTDVAGNLWVSVNTNFSNGHLNFTGTNSYVHTSINNLLRLVGVDFTVRFIASSTLSRGQFVFTCTTMGNGWQIIFDASGNLVFTAYKSTWTKAVELTVAVNRGVEAEYSFERKGSTLYFYINGVLNTSWTIASEWGFSIDTKFYVGGDPNYPNLSLNGTLKKFQIINGAAVGDGQATTHRI